MCMAASLAATAASSATSGADGPAWSAGSAARALAVERMVDVVVVGGGAAGAAVFGELIGRADAGCVHWVAGHGAPGRGVAYSTREDHHLLNVRAAGMGLFDGPCSVFAAHPTAGGAEPHQFVPRSRYGDY